MVIKGCNVRVTEGKLWIPRRNDEVIEYLDSIYERTNPNELMWNEEKPKKESEPTPEKEVYSLADDMDLDGEIDDYE